MSHEEEKPRANFCGPRAIAILTKHMITQDMVRDLVMAAGSKQLQDEVNNGEPISDELFDLVGIHAILNFILSIYISPSQRVELRSLGVLGVGAPIHHVRFEPWGMTSEEVRALPHSPLFVDGHWERDNNDQTKVEVIQPPAHWAAM